MSRAVAKGVHHIDVVVRDLDEAARRYEAALAIRPGPREQLPDRGVDLIRFRVGQTWLVLVQPTGSGGPVSEFLQANGEGFYHIGVEFEDVVAAASAARDRGLRLNEPYPRSGLDGWKLVDVAVEDTSGAMLQLVEVPEG